MNVDFRATVTVTKGYIFKSERVFVMDCYFEDTVNNVENMFVDLMDLYASGATENNVKITYSYDIEPTDVILETPEDYLLKENFDAVTVAIRNFIDFRNPNDPKPPKNNSGGGFRYKDVPTSVKLAGGFAAGYKAGGMFT